MNRKSLTIGLLGGILLFSGAQGLEQPASADTSVPKTTEHNIAPAPINSAVRTVNSAGSGSENGQLVVGSNDDSVFAHTAMKPDLKQINGISLTDDLNTVLKLKGQPERQSTDEFLGDTQILHYSDCTIGVSDYGIEYVEVGSDQNQVIIDGVVYKNDRQVLENALGEPYFVAEDGLVYTQDNQVLKLFINPETDQLESIHFFPKSGE
ncbi:hypothetical protein [Paenibacillus sp. FJAT-26967]|uniref:hypothetical protein n=1 Tax=Paenibacillus sp. FJAT-26967 TaxID=1729690 RepID=UPI00083983CA|nr:hypothetical protein [Paenibacillus sp. FJAT-26967]